MVDNMPIPKDTPTHTWRTRVEYHECDPMGVVHHAVHVQWLSNARSDWCRTLGLPYTKLEDQGIEIWPDGWHKKFSTGERKMAFITDPDGYEVEILEVL